ncbi:Lipopolysaccharide biosynthesis protein WzxC [Paraglaciecola mesophila]|uniref:Lipopolysaccharide biosynthesis protein WzxC n=1 Tax=Paraglaciecola mesophila TaxID=197222 RepID=A0A857JJY5_9ALTE|nr:oligosaccharide flippase family protein [Paraglaciecola mesophila]QHJ11287.1 Lipopolysaccharide biosynthesis protein WzxC [Paraglaciecola mesophila]
MSLTGKTVTSIFYTGSTKLVQRGLGMISMLILARILTPEDFGLVSICTLAVFLFNSLSDVGAKQYIIRAKQIDDDLINTAWTLNILIKGVIWLIFFIFTPEIAVFMDKPEIETPLRFLSVILVVGLISNPGIWLFSRDLNYKPLFKIDITSKLISFTTVLVIAYFDRTYWAMLYGLVLQYLLPSIFSNFVCTHRRKFKLSNIGSQVRFSQWVVINSLVGFARGEGDSILVAKYFNLDMIGVYSIFKSLSSMPLSQLINPATDPLLATFSEAIRDDDFQPYQMNTVLLLLLSLVVPLTAMMAYFDKEIVLLMLGEKWVEHSYIFSILAFMMVPGVLFKVLSEYVMAEGGYKPIVFYQVSMTLITLGILYLIIGGNLEEFSQTRVLISVVSILIFATYFQLKYKLFKFSDMFLFALPLVSAGAATLCLEGLDLTQLHWLSRLILGCSVFSLVYVVMLLTLVYLNRKRYECKLFLSYIGAVKSFARRKSSNKQ